MITICEHDWGDEVMNWEFIKKHRFIYNIGAMNVPIFIHFVLTDNCPLKCKQCYVSKSHCKDMNWEVFEERLGQAKDLGIPRIMLTGGEPLLYPYIVRAVKCINDLQMECIMATSGYGLTEKIAYDLAKAGLTKVYISLNGSTAAIHNVSRSCYHMSVEALKLFEANCILVGLNWVARHDNAYDFPTYIDYAKKNNITDVVVLSNKRNANGNLDSLLTIDDISIIKKTMEDNEGYITLDPCFSYKCRRALGLPLLFGHVCNAGRIFCDVLADGSIISCRHAINHYDIHYVSLSDYWYQAALKERNIARLWLQPCKANIWEVV